MSEIKLYNSVKFDLDKAHEKVLAVGSTEDPYYYYSEWNKGGLSASDCYLILYCGANRLELAVFGAP